MLYDFLFPSKETIALDFGSRYIKAAKFSTTGNKAVLTGFAMTPVPPDAIDKGVLVGEQVVAGEVQKLLSKKLKVKGRPKICITIGGKSVITKKFDIPKTEVTITKEHILWEASQYLPFNIEDVSYDYVELPFLSSDPDINTVLFVAIEKRHVNVYAACLRKYSRFIDVIDTNFFSVQRSFKFNNNEALSPKENIVILDIGYSTTEFIVIRNQHTIFSRTLFSGTSSYEAEVARELSISTEEAHDLMVMAFKNGSPPKEVIQVLQNYNPIFYRNISMGIEFFMNHFSDTQISKCYVIGGGMMMPGLQKEVSQNMGVSVAPLQVLKNFQTKGFSKKQLREIQPFLGCVVGMVCDSSAMKKS